MIFRSGRVHDLDGEPLCFDDFSLQIFKVGVIQMELPLEGAIGHTAAALEHGDGLVQDFCKGHSPSSTRARS
jgi:hypothetical protein